MAHRAFSDECKKRSQAAYRLVSNTGRGQLKPREFAIMCAEYRIKIYREADKGSIFDFPNPGNDSESDELKKFHADAFVKSLEYAVRKILNQHIEECVKEIHKVDLV